MSSYGMTLTILATDLHTAARKDENAGLKVDPNTATFGPAVSEWLREVAAELDAARRKIPDGLR